MRGAARAAAPLLFAAASALFPCPPAHAQPAPTFSKDVAPILFAHCATCHRAGAAAPFPLLTYTDARQHAQQIALLTRARVMPPWKPVTGSVHFVGERQLTDAEIATLESWTAGGAPEGDPHDLPPPPAWSSAWQLGEPDLVVTLPEYTLRPDGLDVFRNFVVTVPGTGVRYVRGFEFSPGSQAVHHANIRVDTTTASRRLDEADPEPGYEGLILNSAEYPDGTFLGWTPGQVIPLAPKGLAWTLRGGSDFVVQLHMRPTGKPERIRPTIALYFTPERPTEHPAMLRLGRQNIDIAPGNAAYRSIDTYTLPVAAEVQAIQPHSHYRARSMKAWASLPDRTVKSLIEIPKWDFAWQDAYRYAAPFWLPAGTTIFTEYEFDNSAANPANPQSPPVRATWGFRSSDEMADTWIQVLTHTDADRQRLVSDFRVKADVEDIAGYEARIREDPGYAALHNDVAVLYLETGQPDGAIQHFETVARLQPRSAAAQFNLATALESASRIDEAVTHYKDALAIDPKYSRAHVNIGTLLLRAGRLTEARDEYLSAVSSDPSNADAQNDLGKVLVALHDTSDGVAHLTEALRLRPDFPEAHFNMGEALMSGAERQAPAAVAHYTAALKLRPDWLPCLERLAVAYASNGQFDAAVATDTRARQLVPRSDAAHLDAIDRRIAAYRSRTVVE